MGMPAKCEVQLDFKNQTPEAFHDGETLMKALRDFHGDKCHVAVYGLEHFGDSSLFFELYSDRYQNTYFQQDLLVKYIKANHADEFQEMNTSVWSADDGDVHLTAEEILDYE